jgi:hypothetical protein
LKLSNKELEQKREEDFRQFQLDQVQKLELARQAKMDSSKMVKCGEPLVEVYATGGPLTISIFFR